MDKSRYILIFATIVVVTSSLIITIPILQREPEPESTSDSLEDGMLSMHFHDIDEIFAISKTVNITVYEYTCQDELDNPDFSEYKLNGTYTSNTGYFSFILAQDRFYLFNFSCQGYNTEYAAFDYYGVDLTSRVMHLYDRNVEKIYLYKILSNFTASIQNTSDTIYSYSINCSGVLCDEFIPVQGRWKRPVFGIQFNTAMNTIWMDRITQIVDGTGNLVYTYYKKEGWNDTIIIFGPCIFDGIHGEIKLREGPYSLTSIFIGMADTGTAEVTNIIFNHYF